MDETLKQMECLDTLFYIATLCFGNHLRAILVLNTFTTCGLPFFIWGIYELHLWSTLLGLTLVILGKMWFLDRMVWVYEDMKDKSKEYLSWEY